MVHALADRWGVTPGLGPRKTVWAELDLRPEGRTVSVQPRTLRP